jgi:hypothetical protein
MLVIVEAVIVLALVGGMAFALRRWIDYERDQAGMRKCAERSKEK